MCSNVDGKCYCKDNRFGLKCQMLCPFGFVNNTCHRSAIENTSCECSNYLHICDLELGCICPEGQDCYECINLKDLIFDFSIEGLRIIFVY